MLFIKVFLMLSVVCCVSLGYTEKCHVLKVHPLKFDEVVDFIAKILHFGPRITLVERPRLPLRLTLMCPMPKPVLLPSIPFWPIYVHQKPIQEVVQSTKPQVPVQSTTAQTTVQSTTPQTTVQSTTSQLIPVPTTIPQPELYNQTLLEVEHEVEIEVQNQIEIQNQPGVQYQPVPEVQNPQPQGTPYPPQQEVPNSGAQYPVPVQEVQYPPAPQQEVPNPGSQYPVPVQEVQYPTPQVPQQYPPAQQVVPNPEVQYPVPVQETPYPPQQEVPNLGAQYRPDAVQEVVQNPQPQGTLYPPQHAGENPSEEGVLYPTPPEFIQNRPQQPEEENMLPQQEAGGVLYPAPQNPPPKQLDQQNVPVQQGNVIFPPQYGMENLEVMYQQPNQIWQSQPPQPETGGPYSNGGLLFPMQPVGQNLQPPYYQDRFGFKTNQRQQPGSDKKSVGHFQNQREYDDYAQKVNVITI